MLLKFVGILFVWVFFEGGVLFYFYCLGVFFFKGGGVAFNLAKLSFSLNMKCASEHS